MNNKISGIIILSLVGIIIIGFMCVFIGVIETLIVVGIDIVLVSIIMYALKLLLD